MPETVVRPRAGLNVPEDLSLLEHVSAATAGVSHLQMCIQCGSCGGSCPSASDMDHTPRMLFAMLRAGLRDEVLHSNTPWICVSCYHCVVRCPQNVHITDVMYTIKAMAIRERIFADTTASDFSETFVEMVEKYGRSFEFGLATTALSETSASAPARYDRHGSGDVNQEPHEHHSQTHQKYAATHRHSR